MDNNGNNNQELIESQGLESNIPVDNQIVTEKSKNKKTNLLGFLGAATMVITGVTLIFTFMALNLGTLGDPCWDNMLGVAFLVPILIILILYMKKNKEVVKPSIYKFGKTMAGAGIVVLLFAVLCNPIRILVENNKHYTNVSLDGFVENWKQASTQAEGVVTRDIRIDTDIRNGHSKDFQSSSAKSKITVERKGPDVSRVTYWTQERYFFSVDEILPYVKDILKCDPNYSEESYNLLVQGLSMPEKCEFFDQFDVLFRETNSINKYGIQIREYAYPHPINDRVFEWPKSDTGAVFYTYRNPVLGFCEVFNETGLAYQIHESDCVEMNDSICQMMGLTDYGGKPYIIAPYARAGVGLVLLTSPDSRYLNGILISSNTDDWDKNDTSSSSAAVIHTQAMIATLNAYTGLSSEQILEWMALSEATRIKGAELGYKYYCCWYKNVELYITKANGQFHTVIGVFSSDYLENEDKYSVEYKPGS
ncbi:MAG: hypothetical protein IKH21_04080 [Clostridia bacterium]|nr:hypothetical protein [Clostridia bacterium]